MRAKKKSKNTTYILTAVIPLFLAALVACDSSNSPSKEADVVPDSTENKTAKTGIPEHFKTYFLDSDSSVLSNLEKFKDTTLLKSFLAREKNIQPEKETAEIGSLNYRYYYTIDLDNNGVDEIVYEGESGNTDIFVTQIFIKKGKAFIKVFSEHNKVHSYKSAGQSISEICIQQSGCCDNPVFGQKFYSVAYKNGEPNFTLYRKTGYLRALNTDYEKYEKEIPIVISIDCCEMYAGRNVVISAKGYGQSHHLTGQYYKQATGMAIGEKTESGESWVLIRMGSKNKFKSYHFSDEEGIELLGWVKKEDIHSPSE